MFLFPKEFHFFAIPGIPPLRGSCSPHHLLLLLVGYGLYLDIKIRKRCKTIYCSHCELQYDEANMLHHHHHSLTVQSKDNRGKKPKLYQ